MKINDVIVEAPMGILQRAGQKIMSKVPGSTGAKAQGKLDTGRVANEWKKQYMQYLGRSNQQPSTETLSAFLKQLGLDDQLVSGTISEYTIFERPLTKAEVDKLILSAAQKASIGGGAAGSAAQKAASSGSPPTGASPASTPAAVTQQPSAPAAGSATPTSTAASAPKPGLLKRAAGAVGQAVKGAMGKVAGSDAATAGAGARVEPTVSAPSGAAGAGAKAAPAKPAGSDIDTYVNNWAKSINAAASSQEKIALAKEVINFLKDRKGSPEGQRGAAMAKAVLKRSNDPKVQQMAQSGAFAMERRIYAVANKLLEAVGLTWKDLGYRVLVTESTAKHVMIGIR